MMKSWRPYLSAVEDFALPGKEKRRIARDVVPQLVVSLQQLGIEPFVGYDLGRIPPIMARHPFKPRVSEVSDPRLNPNAGPHDTFIVVLERNNEDIACACVRLKWVEGTLEQAYRTQSLLLEDPEQRDPQTSWLCRAWLARREIRSQPVLISNGLCFLPVKGMEHADRETALRALMRLLHLGGFGLFKWSWLIGHAIPPVAQKHAHFTDGFDLTDNGLTRIEATGKTDYLFMAVDRLSFSEIALHPSFADLSIKLGQPSSLAGEDR